MFTSRIVLLFAAATTLGADCPGWCNSFECDGSVWCQNGERPAPCDTCPMMRPKQNPGFVFAYRGPGADGDAAIGSPNVPVPPGGTPGGIQLAAGEACYDGYCRDVGEDCCAPAIFNEAMKCASGLRVEEKHTQCFGFKDAAYTCCGRLPSTTLRNGVEMPQVLLGAGGSTWMNVAKTDMMVFNALLKGGFRAIDTANHYRNHEGVAQGIASARRDGYKGDVWLQTKIEGCGNSIDPRSPVLAGKCYEHTLARLDDDLKALRVKMVDLVLIHAPPCVPGASWNKGCVGPDQQDPVYPHLANCNHPDACEMVQQQWKALEAAYAQGKTRAIGVSNYCSACLRCISKIATVQPHVNQVRGANPAPPRQPPRPSPPDSPDLAPPQIQPT